MTRDSQADSRGQPWHEPLEPLCTDACRLADSKTPVEVALFFVARWCQKETGLAEPDITALDEGRLADIAARVVQNLAQDGDRVDRLVTGDADSWTELRRLLYGSAHARVEALADYYADEALQKIAIVLLTGTPPSQAVQQLAQAIEGPANEYVFTSPFLFWAGTVVINLIVDDKRRQARERTVPPLPPGREAPHLDAATIEQAYQALPSLLDAVHELPPVQRSVMVWSLTRRGLDPIVIQRLHQLAPDLFGCTGGDPAGSDADIAARLGTTTRLVAANRSAARCKLAARDPYWKLLLDGLLPHRSSRPAREDDHD